MSSDLISRKALLEDGFLGLVTCNAVRNAPDVHDAVVVTRCIRCVCFVPDCMTRNPRGFDDVGVCSNTGQQVGINDYCSYGTWFGEKMGEQAQRAVAKEHLNQIKMGVEKRMSQELIDREAALMELCLDCLKSFPGKHGCHNPCHAYLSITDLPAVDAEAALRKEKENEAD